MSRLKPHPLRGFAFSALFMLVAANCASIGSAQRVERNQPVAVATQSLPTAVDRGPVLESKPVATDDAISVRTLRAANAAKGMRILVSIKQRQLWLLNNQDTFMVVPVAVGMGEDFEFNGKKFHFKTPMGKRTVLSKSESPIWTVPDWHYMERASWEDHELVYLKANDKVELSDGTFLEVRGKDVGRVNQFGNFWAFEPGLEIMFDDKVFVPPVTSNQRRVPDALGPYKLDTGDGYLIHGTHIYNEDSVGDAVSHGCVRMDNYDLERLYFMVKAGTPVFIF